MTTINESPASLAIPTGRRPSVGAIDRWRGAATAIRSRSPSRKSDTKRPPVRQGRSKLNSLDGEPPAPAEDAPRELDATADDGDAPVLDAVVLAGGGDDVAACLAGCALRCVFEWRDLEERLDGEDDGERFAPARGAPEWSAVIRVTSREGDGSAAMAPTGLSAALSDSQASTPTPVPNSATVAASALAAPA